MEEMQARVKSQLGPAVAAAAASPDRRSPLPPPNPPPSAQPEPAASSSPPQPGSPLGLGAGGDRDYRVKDQDYRMMNRNSRSPPSGNGVSSFGDTDYRQHAHSQPQRRRALMEEEDDSFYSKRRRRGGGGGALSPESSAGAGLLPPPPAAPSLPLLPEPTTAPIRSGSETHPHRNGPSGASDKPGPRRGRVNKWGRPAICKFFREGYCRDGDNCTYSHAAVDSCRKPELCKFYQQGFCKKSLGCPFLHGEWPCKAHHKGECSKGEDCPFSHSRLDDFTRPIYEQMLKDEELAATIKLPPQASTKRKTLLPMPLQPPGLPATTTAAATTNANLEPIGSATTTSHTSRFDRTEHPNAYKTSVASSAFTTEPTPLVRPIPPPVPPMGAPPLGMALPPPGLVTIQQVVAPTPVSHSTGLLATPAPQPLLPPATSSLLPTPSSAPVPLISRGTLLGNAPMPVPIPQPIPPVMEPPAEPSYNINEMLAKIKASVGGAAAQPSTIPDEPEEPDESPASPTADLGGGSLRGGPAIIGQVQYRLVACYIPEPPNQVTQELLNLSLSDSKLANDPRIKKCLSNQFSEASALIGAAATAAANQAHAKAAAAAAAASGKSRDPRASARDPRKKAAPRDPRQPQPQDNGGPGPSYEEMVAMQLRMTAELAAESAPVVSDATSPSSFAPLPGPMLNEQPSSQLPAFLPPSTTQPPSFDSSASNPGYDGQEGGEMGIVGWMPSLKTSALGEEESELASLGLPVLPPLDAASRYNLPGVKVRKLKSEG